MITNPDDQSEDSSDSEDSSSDEDQDLWEIVATPGLCYLWLFKQETWSLHDWPKYPTWSQIASFNETLRNEDIKVSIKKGHNNI